MFTRLKAYFNYKTAVVLLALSAVGLAPAGAQEPKTPETCFSSNVIIPQLEGLGFQAYMRGKDSNMPVYVDFWINLKLDKLVIVTYPIEHAAEYPICLVATLDNIDLAPDTFKKIFRKFAGLHV